MRLLPCVGKKKSFQKTLMWPPKAKFEVGWRISWVHKDMCLISYLYCNSKNKCALSLPIWIVTLEIQGEIHGLSLMRQLLIFLYKYGKLSPIKSCEKLELFSSFEQRIRLWHLTHECSFILTWFCLHMEHLDLPSLILLDHLPKMCEIYLLLQIKVYLLH